MQKLAAFILAVPCGFAAYTALLLFNPLPTVTTPIITMVNGFAAQIISYLAILQNPVALASLGSAASGLLVNTIRSKMQQAVESKAKQQIETLHDQLIKLHNEKAQLEQKNRELQTQIQKTANTDLQAALAESQALVTQKNREIEQLQAQIRALQEALLLKDTKVVEKTVVK